MLPFSLISLSAAVTEGVVALSRFDTHTHTLMTHFLSCNDFSEKTKQLQQLLNHVDTGTSDYKRFSFMIQLLWEKMNPQLNPFLYKDITLDKIISALCVQNGVMLPPSFEKTWDFEIGRNIAMTPGTVVFENEIAQLLYYPGTRGCPVFIVPPWINKYYIFDLSPHNSFIRWMIEQGISVFCMSWINPDHRYSDVGFRDYIHTIDRASSVARHMMGSHDINYMGYCVGGVALMVYAAWKSAHIKTLTFLATPFDFSLLDDLSLFTGADEYAYLQHIIEREGVLSGTRLMAMFSLMRAHDLIFQPIIDRIYQEKPQRPLDFLFWNADSVNIPGALHLDYLRDILLPNAFMTGTSSLYGLSLDYEAIQCPVYNIATQKDHIVPWKASYAGCTILPQTTFCLGGAGHVAGIINPPHQEKYGYSTSMFQSGAPSEYLGSWWTHWLSWIRPHLGPRIKKRMPSNAYYIEPAPGRYVRD